MSVFPFAGPRRGRAAVLEAMAGIAKGFALESYTPKSSIVDGDRAAVMSDVGYRQRATDRVLRLPHRQFPAFPGRPRDRIPRIHQQLRRRRAGARARIAA